MLHQSVRRQLRGVIPHSERQRGKDLLLLLKKLHLLDLTLETMGSCPGMNRDLGDTAEPLQFMLLLELLQILAALMISAQLAQRKTKKANGSIVMSQTNMGLLLFHSSVSEHKEDADQQSLQGECEKRAQPSAETSVQPKRQCSGKRAWLACMISHQENPSWLQLQWCLWMQEASWRGALSFSHGKKA